jgi:hypothetical protein
MAKNIIDKTGGIGVVVGVAGRCGETGPQNKENP